MDENTGIGQGAENDKERAERLKREAQRRTADQAAEDKSVDEAIRRSIDLHGA